LKGLHPFTNHPPPHDRNIYPYHGEGDTGGEVDKQPPRRTKLEPAKAGEGKRIR